MRDRLIELLGDYLYSEQIADHLLENGVIVHDIRPTDEKVEELKSCPFCGSTNVVLREGAMWNGAVHCLDCTADVVFDAVRMIKDGDYNWKSAITKGWNNRTEAKLKEGGKG